MKPLSLLRHWQALAILFLTLLIALIHIWRWHYIFEGRGQKFGLKELAGLWLAGFAISYLTPIALMGGEAFMALALRKKFSLSWQRSIASVLVLKILNLSIILIFMIFGLLAFLVLVGLPSHKVTLLSSLIVFGLGTILILFYYRAFREKTLFARFLKKFEGKIPLNSQAVLETERKVFALLRPSNRVLSQHLLLALLANFLNIFRFWLIILFLTGITLDIFQSLAVFSFVNMAYIVPLPATLGSLEASQAYAFASLGLGPEAGTAFSLVLRGAELCLTIVGLFFVLRIWFKTQAFSWFLERFAITKKE